MTTACREELRPRAAQRWRGERELSLLRESQEGGVDLSQ